MNLAPLALLDELDVALRALAFAQGADRPGIYAYKYGALLAALSEPEARRILAEVSARLSAPSVDGRAVAL